MGEDRSTYEQRQTQIRREAEKEALLDDRKGQIVEVHGEEIGKRVAAYGTDDEISQAAVGLIAERIAKTTINIENFDVHQVNVQVDQRRIGEAVDEAQRQAAPRVNEEVQPQQAVTQPPEFGTPEWKEQAETVGRQHGQNQRYDELDNLSEAQSEAQVSSTAEQAQGGEEKPQKRDLVTEFLEAEKLDREERKAVLKELAHEYGHQITEHAGHSISRDRGGGQSY
jgi:hypothetical protein